MNSYNKTTRQNTATRGATTDSKTKLSKAKRSESIPLSAFVPRPPLGASQSKPSSPNVLKPVVVTTTKPKLLILRGAPGSGKSTLARTMFSNWTITSTDNYYIHFGGNYDTRMMNRAHDMCIDRAREALTQGNNVVVDNTLSTLKELNLYLTLSNIADIRVYRVVSQFKGNFDAKYLSMYESYTEEKKVKLNLFSKKIIFCNDEKPETSNVPAPTYTFKGKVSQMNHSTVKVGNTSFNVDPELRISELCAIGDFVAITYRLVNDGPNVVCDVRYAGFN